MIRHILIVGLALALAPRPAQAQRAAEPADATVLIRVSGNVHLEVDEFGATRVLERRDAPIGSGTGFVVSPFGYVVTANHVVATREWTEQRPGGPARVRVEPTRIEVVFPRRSGSAGVPQYPLAASVIASDAAADLAVLFATGSFPYVALGDSAAVERGHRVQVMGYPFGSVIDALLNETGPDQAPQITIATGTATALRTDPSGDLHLIQTDSRINPGNSGGPLLDEDGYAVGVVVSEVTQGSRSTGLGFAVPINVLKSLLEAHGLDQLIPGRRLRVGPPEELAAKRIRMHSVEGRSDVSPFRVRVDLGAAENGVTFRADRVYTTWTMQEVERWLLSEPALEPALVVQRPRQSVVERTGRLRGRAVARDRATGEAIELIYAVVDLGREKVIARFVGAAEQIAFNRSVIDAALAAFDAGAVLSGTTPEVSTIAWTSGAFLASDAPPVGLPTGWVLERGAAVAICEGIQPAPVVIWVSPPDDFTVSLRLAWWPPGTIDVKQAAVACGDGPGGQGVFVQRSTWVGVPYATQAVARAVEGGGLVQFAVVAPAQRLAPARAILEAWVKQVPR